VLPDFFQIKRGVRLQLTLKYEHRDEVRNVEPANVRRALRDYVGGAACRSARLFGSAMDLEIAISKRGAARLLSHKPALVAEPGAQEGAASAAGAPPPTTITPAAHDRAKLTRVDAAAPFLVALGVSSPEGKPRPGMAAKLRQIERFVDTLAGLVGAPHAGEAAGQATFVTSVSLSLALHLFICLSMYPCI